MREVIQTAATVRRGGGAKGGEDRKKLRNDERVLLLRQYFGEVLSAFDYISVEVDGADVGGVKELQVFQVLALERKVHTVATCFDKYEPEKLYNATVQPMQCWGSRNAVDAQELDVFQWRTLALSTCYLFVGAV